MNLVTDGCFVNNLVYWSNPFDYWNTVEKPNQPECEGLHKAAKLGPPGQFGGQGVPNTEASLSQVIQTQVYGAFNLTFRYVFVRATYLRANLYGWDENSSQWVLMGTAVEILSGSRSEDMEFLHASGQVANPQGYTLLKLEFAGMFPAMFTLGMKLNCVELVGVIEEEGAEE